jgi:hypothetical protein
VDEAKDLIPWAALGISSLAFFVSWRSYSLARQNALHKRPYLNGRNMSQRDIVRLEGPEKEHWEIVTIRLLWPLRCTFVQNKIESNKGGSISKSWLEDIGRNLTNPNQPLSVSPSSEDSFALVSASSKTRPKISQRWVIRIKRRD